MNIISARNLEFAYDLNRKIIDNLSVDIEKEKINVIIGPNGCGKTTLLKLLSRILLPSNGDIKVDGVEIKSFSRIDISQKISFMGARLPDISMTGEEFVLLGRLPYGKPFNPFYTKKDREVARKSLEQSGVLDLSNRLLTDMSTGQRQLLSLAKQLCQESDILFLDEPTANLDPKHEIDLIRVLQESVRNGKTVVLVVHDLNLAARFSDRVILMQNGNIIKVGKPIDVMTDDDLSNLYGTTLSSKVVDGEIMVTYR